MSGPAPGAAGPEAAAPRPRVTFFVMAYRQEATVRAAVEGAFAQTWPDLEIVLSDDASPDGTFAIMEEMAAAYDGPHRVILNRNPTNLGICAHIDRIMELSTGEFVIQNAGDDVSRPGRTEALAGAWLASGRRAKLVCSPGRVIDAEGRDLGPKEHSARLRPGLAAEEAVAHNMNVLGATTGWDRELFRVFGPLGPDLGVEDTVLPVRALLLGEIRQTPEPLLLWRAGGTSWADRRAITGRDYLFGARLKVMRWRVQNMERIAADLDDAPMPEARRAACRALARRRRDEAAFDVALADGSTLARLGLVKRALALARRHGSAAPLRQWLKYLLAPLYVRWLDWRYTSEDLRW